MILLLVWQFSTPIDSLARLLEADFQFSYLVELNQLFLKERLFDSACAFLRKYADRFGIEEQAQLNLLIGDNLFFKPALAQAREEYLKTVARYPNAKAANDALERLYLFESVRTDTVTLKRFAQAIYLYEIKNLQAAQDSLKFLTRTSSGDYAWYYLALIYEQRGEYNQALAVLEQLLKDFPTSRIHQAQLLVAEICLKVNKKKEAIKLLEELVVKYPNLPVGIRAKERLKDLVQIQ